MKHFLLFCSVGLLATPALAESFTYGPESCEFQITFPEKPYIEKKCRAAQGSEKSKSPPECAEIVSYTKAVGASASTEFRVTCQSITADERNKYNSAILEETLKKMLQDKGLEAFNTKSGDKGNYKTAATLSLTTRDGKPLIYSSQLWVGQKSMFTIEAEMLGEKNDEIEKIFADILKKTYPKDSPPPSPNPAKKSNDEQKTNNEKKK